MTPFVLTPSGSCQYQITAGVREKRADIFGPRGFFSDRVIKLYACISAAALLTTDVRPLLLNQHACSGGTNDCTAVVVQTLKQHVLSTCPHTPRYLVYNGYDDTHTLDAYTLCIYNTYTEPYQSSFP